MKYMDVIVENLNVNIETEYVDGGWLIYFRNHRSIRDRCIDSKRISIRYYGVYIPMFFLLA